MSIQAAQCKSARQCTSQKPSNEKNSIACPHCGSDANYRYGHTIRGLQRYLCLACDRQFSLGGTRRQVNNRPVCSHCQRPMHVYKREERAIRFRCANYPKCKIFQKVAIEK